MGWLINNHFGLRHVGSVVLPSPVALTWMRAMGPSTALKFELRRSQIQRGQEASALNRNAASTLASHNPQRVRSGDRLSLGIDNIVSVLADWE